MPTGGAVGGIKLMRQQQQSQPSTPMSKGGDDEDEVEDIEMDDAIGPMDRAPGTPAQQNQQHQPAQQSLFGQQQRPSLNLNSNGLQHAGLRTSQPPTPAASGFGFQHNPTVSSVNTPTLSTTQHQTFSPDTSVPGTPAGEMDDDFSGMQNNMSRGNLNMSYPFGFGQNDLGLDLCIDEPAKRLFSPNGGSNNQRALQQQFAQFGLGQGQYGNHSDLMTAYRQQQMMAMNEMGSNPQAAALLLGEEHKPFRCPVIGCEKAYKNQNGLKCVSPLPTFWHVLTSIGTTKRTVTKRNSYTRTATERSRSSTPRPQLLTLGPSGWKRRSLTNARFVASDTRT
jgi:transcription factor SFP1